MQLDVLWPPENVSEEEVKKDINEEAMVLELKYGELKGLFTGDIGQETEAQLKAAGVLEDVDFLKVAHHGSRYSTGMEFLETVIPEVAVDLLFGYEYLRTSFTGDTGTSEGCRGSGSDHEGYRGSCHMGERRSFSGRRIL